MSNILEQLQLNIKLVKKIESIISTFEVPDSNKKAMLFTGFLQNAISHYLSINILIEKKLYNSAFSLERVFFDTIIRGQYIVYIYADDKVDEMYFSNNWSFPKTKIMCPELDTFFGADIFEKIRLNVYGMMCEYTHVGNNQIARHFNEGKNTIEPNFDDELIVDTLKGNYILLELFAKNYLEFMKQSNLLNNEVSL